MNDDQNTTPDFDSRRAFNWFMSAIEGPAMTLKVFLHYRFGSQQPGIAGVLALVILVLFIGICPPYSPWPLIGFIVAYLAMLVCRRTGVMIRYMRQDEEHSWFDGYSVVSRVCPFITDEFAKRNIEPLIGIVAGIALAPFSPPLCVYLVMASFCLALTTHARDGIRYRQLKRMRDQYIEQKSRVQSFRDCIDNSRL